MRLKKARIEPLGDEVMSAEQAAYLRERAASPLILGIHRTMAHDPKTQDAFLAWGGHSLSRDNGLASRQREVVILRTGFLCKSGYEWAQHIRMGAREGLTEAAITAIKAGADDPIWSEADRALLRMADELHADQFISDGVWRQLKAHFDTRAIFIAIMAAGQYTLVSMFLNSVGVQLDEGQVLDPDLAKWG